MRPQLPEGHRVQYRHRRRSPQVVGAYVVGYGPGLTLSEKGGETEAKIYGPDDSVVAIGIATCHPRDNFNRRMGRNIALGRALKQLRERADG